MKLIHKPNLNTVLFSVFILGFSSFADADTGSASYNALTPAGKRFYKKYSPTVKQTSSKNSSKSLDNYNTEALENNAPPNTLTSTHGLLAYRGENNDFSAKLTGYGIFSFIAPQNSHSYFNAYLYPAFIFRYKDQFEWDSLLNFYLSTNGSTTTDLDFSYIDWFVTPNLTLEGGYFFSPIGKFVRDFYLPWFNKLPSRPAGFGYDEAAPQSDVGFQIKAALPVFQTAPLHLTLYIANGPEEELASGQINNINSSGYGSDQDGHKVLGGRLSLAPLSGLELGVSGAYGKTGLLSGTTLLDSSRRYYSWGLDATYYLTNLSLYAEYIQQFVGGDAASLYPSGERWSAWYVQAAYRLPKYNHWEGVIRYGNYVSPIGSQKKRQGTLGIDYWFAPTIVAKLAYEINDGQQGSSANSNKTLVQFSYGFS